jgi:hypothetical protein
MLLQHEAKSVIIILVCSAWDLVEADCRKALELDNSLTKVSIGSYLAICRSTNCDPRASICAEAVEMSILGITRLLRLQFPVVGLCKLDAWKICLLYCFPF